MQEFFESHFSALATKDFSTRFLSPITRAVDPDGELPSNDGEEVWEGYDEAEDYDDGLGFYEDGVKRTLTDDQIEIFRHSEREALRRAEEKGASSTAPLNVQDAHGTSVERATIPSLGRAAAGDDSDDDVSEGEMATGKKRRRKNTKRRSNNRKGQNHQPAEPFVDLRKRTWDVVEKGLQSLNYDEDDGGHAEERAATRRRISYDDN